MGQANNTQAARSALIVVRAGGQQNESSDECSHPAAQLHVMNTLSTWQLQLRCKERGSPSPHLPLQRCPAHLPLADIPPVIEQVITVLH
jgi:hypothetical protein